MAFSELEAARYIETLKLFEKKAPEMIRGGAVGSVEHEDSVADCLTTIKSVNSSDAVQLGITFGTVQALAGTASVEELLLCPGLGMKKAQRIVECFNTNL